MGESFISGNCGINKQYVDSQDNKKVDKIEGKMLSSNDFTDIYKLKIESAIQEIRCNDQVVSSQQNIVNLTPSILGAMVVNSIERQLTSETYFLRINAEKFASNSVCSFYAAISDRNGTGIFANMGAILIYHMAIDIADPTRYLFSIGYKNGNTSMHHLNVISNNAITLGDKNNLGTQVINNTDNREVYVRQMALCVRLD